MIPYEISICFEKTIYHFSPFFGVHGCPPVAQCNCGRGLGAAQGPQKAEGSRCSETHSQPYLNELFQI